MKHTIASLFTTIALTISALAHGGVELGPNGGRILEFSKNETTHGEVTVKGDKFQIEILDKDKKPVALADQELTATSGDRNNPQKFTVEKKDGKFTIPLVKDGEWIVFQFKENPKAKAITARLQYDTENCAECSNPEWLCKCKEEDEKKGKEKK